MYSDKVPCNRDAAGHYIGPTTVPNRKVSSTIGGVGAFAIASSCRVYSHVVIGQQGGDIRRPARSEWATRWKVIAWAGRIDIARKRAKTAQRSGEWVDVRIYRVDTAEEIARGYRINSRGHRLVIPQG
jgi:hypothetical protein